MPLLRAVARLKLFHLGAVAAAATALTGSLAGTDATLAAATAGAAAGGAGAMTWLQTRWVGEVSVPRAGVVRLSTLDAAGRRRDADVPAASLVAPYAGLDAAAARAALAGGPGVLAVGVEGEFKQYLLAPRAAAVVDAAGLAEVLAGREAAP